MTIFRLGYVAMSMHVINSSPSKTMTYKNFSQHKDREAAISKLELLANKNIDNSLRLLKHNKAFGISLFRLSSRLIPLATHEDLEDWDYIEPTKDKLRELGDYASKNKMRIDFHPDHFVVLNSPKSDVVKSSVKNLKYHYDLLTAMGVNPRHRCVLHTGGSYGNKVAALERFIDNWGRISQRLQQMIILENDDKTFNSEDVLYLSEKLSIPHVFDLHHHEANNNNVEWTEYWDRIVKSWSNSEFPVKVHLSSPKNEKQFRHHADYVDPNMFTTFINKVKGSVDIIDCMIEAKQKDAALFQLVRDLKKEAKIEWISDSSFQLK
ncbi:UV DNA damage repair endonuclease UvsE [Aquibacillus halophilus]|uniref:UV DNA damage repair endonuclease UvsE n=1 Tax=Aquibacillus halophilus TaxID=930132 RepID=A0A6A8DDD8_9BACI|nr:UV DNA damage repair endonuclease UvsE [Aquibacillus halophilus]MRH42546.1 UV DNA damage repair endonuclease UvsE [Aquibacillus halophilus]